VERYGDAKATYRAVDEGPVPSYWGNVPARLTCDVTYSRSVWAVFRRVRKNWIAPAGTYCFMLGRWSDGSVRLQVGLTDVNDPSHRLAIDGRFPDWVAEQVAERPMLKSNIPAKRWRWFRR
jgi:hypothetical protein